MKTKLIDYIIGGIVSACIGALLAFVYCMKTGGF